MKRDSLLKRCLRVLSSLAAARPACFLRDKAISEDDERRGLEEIQKMTDGYISRVDAASKAKEKEILEIK